MPEQPDAYLTVAQLCEEFTISKSKFYRMLADEDNGLVDLAIRIPPVTGQLRVPRRAFIAWASGRGKRGG